MNKKGSSAPVNVVHPLEAFVPPEKLEVQRGEEMDVRRQASICEALNNFSSRTSLNGIIFIQTSSDYRMKLFWTVFFLSAVMALLYHSYSTVCDYLEYSTHIRVERIMEESLQLPAVTICNHNPIRLSKKSILSDDLQKVLEDARNNIDSLADGSKLPFTNNDSLEEVATMKLKLINNFYYGLNDFIYNVTSEDRDSMQEAGHQIEDMLLWCVKGNEVCLNVSTKMYHSDEYNNCYTLDTSMLEQTAPGDAQGLELALYLEPDEYLPGITDSKAFTIQAHPRNAYIFPNYDGMKLTPGMMTTVALTLENVTKLGQPYSSCVETDDYIDKYNFSYSVDLCKDICMLHQYISNCGCYLSVWMNVGDNPNNVSVCEEDYVCTKDLFDPKLCSCETPCRQVHYNTRVSTAYWPSYTLGKVLVEFLCAKTDFPPERCQKLRNQSESELRENFVGVRLYYESMFYTQLTDVAEINLATFLSNLGGCVGLWIGVSVLSLVELLHLFADIIWSAASGVKNRIKSAQTDKRF